MSDGLGACSRWQGPVRSIIQAPSAAIFSCAPSRAHAPCRAHVRTTPSGKAAPHSRRSHAAAPRSQVPSGQKSGVHLVLASDATAWSLHSGKRRRQLTVASATIVQNAWRRAARRRHRAAIHAGPVAARFGRRPPAASFPPGPPILGTPLARFARWNKESPGGKDALARRRFERRGRRRRLRLGGTARDHGPRSRPFPHQPLPPPRGPAACRATGPAGVGQTSRLGRRRALGTRASAPVRAPRRCRLRSPPPRRSWPGQPRTRIAARRLQRGSLRRPWNSARLGQAAGRYEK